MHFFGNKSKEVFGALIDISSGSVGIAIVASNPDQALPKILYASRTPMRISAEATDAEKVDFRRAKEALLAAALTLSHEGIVALSAHNPHARISKLCVTCSSPWSYTVARNVRYENNTPFKITKTIIEDLVKSAEDEILLHLNELAEEKNRRFEVVEKATVDISVNDYLVKSPYKLKGSTLALSHVVGVIPKEILDNVEEAHEKLFQETEVRSHTYMLIMYCVMRDIFPKIHSSCIIDITGEVTEFGIMEHDLLIENSYISSGSSTLIRDAVHATGSPVASIHTTLSSFASNVCIQDESLTSAIKAYKENLIAGIAKITEHRSLPPNIILTAQTEYINAFRCIITEAIQESLGDGYTVIVLDKNVIKEVSEGAGEDVYLAIGARFFHKLHGCTELDESN